MACRHVFDQFVSDGCDQESGCRGLEGGNETSDGHDRQSRAAGVRVMKWRIFFARTKTAACYCLIRWSSLLGIAEAEGHSLNEMAPLAAAHQQIS